MPRASAGGLALLLTDSIIVFRKTHHSSSIAFLIAHRSLIGLHFNELQLTLYEDGAGVKNANSSAFKIDQLAVRSRPGNVGRWFTTGRTGKGDVLQNINAFVLRLLDENGGSCRNKHRRYDALLFSSSVSCKRHRNTLGLYV